MAVLSTWVRGSLEDRRPGPLDDASMTDTLAVGATRGAEIKYYKYEKSQCVLFRARKASYRFRLITASGLILVQIKGPELLASLATPRNGARLCPPVRRVYFST